MNREFPKRSGKAIGKANENKMFSSTDPNWIHTRQQENYESGITTLKTSNGFPIFWNTPSPEEEEDEFKSVIYPYGLVDTTYHAAGQSKKTKLEFLIDETGAETNEENTAIKDSTAWKADLYGDLPTLYSGLMRRVIQVKHAATPSNSAKAVHKKITERVDSFSCSYATTHGLYMSGNGTRWVIEVDSTGIYRIPITFFSAVTRAFEEDEAAALLAAPSYRAFTKSVSAQWAVKKFDRTERVKIGDAPASYAEGYKPWYSWCGWAFDRFGEAATLVCVKTSPISPTLFRSAMFDITITGDDWMPLTAACNKTEEQDWGSTTNDSGIIANAVLKLPVAPGYVVKTSTYSAAAAALGAVNAPMFSFYDKGGKQVYRFQAFPQLNGARYNNYTSGFDLWMYPTGEWLSGFSERWGDPYTPAAAPAYFYAPVFYNYCETMASGVAEEWRNGYHGGGVGFSGPGVSSHNVNEDGTYSVRTLALGQSGWASSLSGNNPPYAGNTCDYVEGMEVDRDPPYAMIPYKIYQPFPEGYYDQDQHAWKVTVRYSGTSSGRTMSVSHDSTLVLSGMDRQAAAVVFSKYTNSGSDTTTMTYDKVRFDEGPYVFTMGGAKIMAINEKIGHPHSFGNADRIYDVKGFFPCQEAVGAVAAIHYPPTVNSDGSGGAVSTASYVVNDPAQSTTTRELVIRVAGETVSLSPATDKLHRAEQSGETTKFYLGASAWNQFSRYFYSVDGGNADVTVQGVGVYTTCVRNLNNFIGVF